MLSRADFFDDDDDFDFEMEDMLEGITPAQIMERLLFSLTVGEMRQIARRRVWKIKGVRKDDLITQMVEHLLASLDDPKMLAGLKKDELALLAGTNTLFGFTMPLSIDDFNMVWQDVLKRRGTAVSALNGLKSYGLLVQLDGDWGVLYYPLVNIPSEKLPVLPLVAPTLQIPERQALVASLPTASFINQIERIGYYSAAGGRLGLVPSLAQHARNLPPGEEEFWMGNWPFLPQDRQALKNRNMFQFLSRPPVLTVPFRTQVVDDQTYLALQNSVDDRTKLDWLVSLMAQMQIFDLAQTGDEFVCNQDGWHFFSTLPDSEKKTALFKRWYLGSTDLYELRSFLNENPKLSVWRTAHPDISFELFVTEFILARQFVVRLLQGLAQDKQKAFRWYSLPQFIEGVLKLDPEIYDRNDLGEFWGFSRDGKRDYPQEGEDWDAAVEMWLTIQFSGPLNWLNMVDLVVDHGRVQAFRLTSLGAHLLAPETHLEHTAVESGGTAEWLPDGSTIRFTPGADINALMGLVTRLAVPVSGAPFTFRLGGPGLENSFADGDTPESIATQFAKLDHPLPPEAQTYLDNLYTRFGRVHLYDNLTLIEFGDDTAVVELRAAGFLDNIILYEFSPRLIAIKTDQAEDLFQKLENKGYTPQMTTGEIA